MYMRNIVINNINFKYKDFLSNVDIPHIVEIKSYSVFTLENRKDLINIKCRFRKCFIKLEVFISTIHDDIKYKVI